MNPLRRPMREALLDDVTAMHRCPIPHDPQAARHLPPQMLQKGHDIGSVDRPALAGNRQLAVGGNGAHGREMIASPPLLETRRVAHRGIGADHTGQGRESGLIDEEEALPVGLRPLLMAGQVSWRQRARRASSRWRARRAGFWRLQRSVLSKRPTGLGRWRSASGPPSRARFIHWLTAPWLTPRASVMWRCDQPCGMRCQAGNRRTSFPFVGGRFMHGRVSPTLL